MSSESGVPADGGYQIYVGIVKVKQSQVRVVYQLMMDIRSM